MDERLTSAFVVFVFLTAPAFLRAQLCSGNASFRNGIFSVGAGLGFGSKAKSYGAAVAIGEATGAWISGTVSQIDYDDIPEGAVSYGTTAGYSVPIGSGKKAEICPAVAFGYQSGPNQTFQLDPVTFTTVYYTERDVALGASIGGVVASTRKVDVVPSFAAAYDHARWSVKYDGERDSGTEDSGSLSFGVGFVINKVVTIVTVVAVPIGLPDAKASFGLGLGFNFGPKRQTP